MLITINSLKNFDIKSNKFFKYKNISILLKYKKNVYLINFFLYALMDL